MKNITQKEDGGTVATATDSVGDTASGSESASTPVIIADSSSISSCGSAKWSLVVNGTRYVGHVRPERNIVTEFEDKDNSVGPILLETVKERNRRLLVRDRIIQARLNKTRRSRRPRNCSKQVEIL